MKNRVAVVISCYNHEPFIKECINSVKGQTYKDFTIHFWDNNSTDGSFKEAFKHLIPEASISDFGLKKVLPIGIARWLMVTEVPAQYSHIAILDADDQWGKYKLERQMPLFDDPEVKMVFSDCYYLHWRKETVQVGGFPAFTTEKIYTRVKGTFHEKYPPKSGDVFFDLLYGDRFGIAGHNFMPCPTLVFDRKALMDVIGNPMHYTSAEDYDWCLKMTAKYKCAYAKEPLAYYRIHDTQITQKTPARCTAEEIDVVRTAMHYRLLTSRQKRKVYRHLLWLYAKLIYKEVQGLKNERNS